MAALSSSIASKSSSKWRVFRWDNSPPPTEQIEKIVVKKQMSIGIIWLRFVHFKGRSRWTRGFAAVPRGHQRLCGCGGGGWTRGGSAEGICGEGGSDTDRVGIEAICEGYVSKLAPLLRFIFIEKVASYKQLGSVEFVDEIPKSASGKILRRVLREKDTKKSP